MVDRSDFEVSDEVVEVERPPRGGAVVSTRLSADEADQLQQIAQERDLSLSQIVREAIAVYLRTGAGRRPEGPTWTSTITTDASLQVVASGSNRTPSTRGHLLQEYEERTQAAVPA